MTIIYLIRHGQASFSADDYDQLSETGIAQATFLGQYLRKKIAEPTSVITGDMFRHKQTANNCLQAFNTLVDNGKTVTNEDKRWNEYDHQNILGAYKTELNTAAGVRRYLAGKENSRELFKTLYLNAIAQWVNAEQNLNYIESFDDFSARVISGLKAVVKNNSDGHIFVYTSGGPISIIVCHLLGLPLSQFIDVNWSLVNAGVTKIVTRGKEQRLTLSTLNEHDIFEQQSDNKMITYT
jgi:broad specificity phosphatase PhoE